jgi:hypothetical protein
MRIFYLSPSPTLSRRGRGTIGEGDVIIKPILFFLVLSPFGRGFEVRGIPNVICLMERPIQLTGDYT